MKKITKKVISLALTLTMILSMATVINVSAAEETLLNLDMSSDAVFSFQYESTSGYAESTEGNRYMVAKGYFGFGLSKAAEVDSTVTISFDMYAPTQNNASYFWVGDHNKDVITFLDYKGSTESWLKPSTSAFQTYKVKINPATGDVVYYLNNNQVDTANFEFLKGLEFKQIGFTDSGDNIYLDNVKVVMEIPERPDGVLVDLDMNTDAVANKDYADWMIQEGPVYEARTTGDNYMGVKGVIGFPFDETVESDRLTLKVDLSGGGSKYNYAGVSVHLNSNATTLKTFTTDDLDAWATWTFEINLVNGQVDIFKNGTFSETVVVDAVKGMKPAYVGFTKWAYQMWIDNLYVQEGLVGTVADYTGADAKTFTNTIATFNLDKSVAGGTMVLEYDLMNDGTGFYTSASLRSESDPNNVGASILKDHANWTNKNNWIHIKHIIDIDGAKVTTYEGNATEGTTVENVENLGSGFSTKQVRFDCWSNGTASVKNLKAYMADPVLKSSEVSGNKYITLTYPNIMDSYGITVKDPNGNTVDCTVAVNDNVITIASEDFESATNYIITGIKDIYGNTATAVSVTTEALPTSCGGITVSGNTATAKFYVSKDDNLKSVQCILASYDKDGILVNAYPVNKTYETAADDSFDVPLDVTAGYTTLRAFMWTGDNVPVIDVTIYPAN